MIPSFAYYFIPILVLIGIRKCRERDWGTCKNKIQLSRKVVIVTGASSGIGFEIAKDLAKRQAQVIMACRNLDAAAKAICKIKHELNCTSVIVPMELDLASIRSVKNFADEIKSTYSEVHLLINNAGVAFPDDVRQKTKDGFEIHMGTNHLGHFLLTNLLLEPLLKAKSSRVVIVTSTLYEKGKLYLEDLNLEKVTRKTDAYANSKLANVYFCKELATRTENTGLRVYAACPGWVYTNLFRHYKRTWYQNLLMLPIAFLFMRTPKQGAQTPIYCATEPSLRNESGCVYKDCKKYSLNLVEPKISQKLWEASEKMIHEVDKKLTQRGLDEELCM